MVDRFFHESEKQYTDSDIRSIVKKYGTNILIGGDPGWSEFSLAMKAAKSAGAKRHVYLVGPGMEEWSNEEAEEIKKNARSVGIDTTEDDWKPRWFNHGFILKCEEWFTTYNAEGFYSAEIDNLDASFNNDPMMLINFYQHMFDFFIRNHIKTKIMVKNLSENELRTLISVPKLHSILCEFGMFEAGSGDPKEQTRLAALCGIQAVTPLNGLRKTKNYGTIKDGVAYLVK